MENDKTNELLKQLIELQKVQIEQNEFSNKKAVSVIRADNAQTVTFIFIPGRDNPEGDVAQRKNLVIPQNSYLFQGSTDLAVFNGYRVLYPTQTLIPSYFPFNWLTDTPGDLNAIRPLKQNGLGIMSSQPFSRFMVRNKFMVTKMDISFPFRAIDNYVNEGDIDTSLSRNIQPFTYSAMRAMVGKQETHSGVFMRNDAPLTSFPNNTQDSCHTFVAENCNFIFDGSTTLVLNNTIPQAWVANGGQSVGIFVLRLHLKNIYNS